MRAFAITPRCTAHFTLLHVSTHAADYSGFAERYPQERVYVSFDNTSYLKGENIYYKANILADANVKTDADGCAHISFYNNSRTNDLHVAAEGIRKDDGAMILY